MGKDEKVKKPFLVTRIWRRLRQVNWNDPINKWKLLFFSVVAFVMIAGFSYGAIAATSTTSFCSSCHEMSPEYVSHISTTHSEIKCTACHIEPGFTSTILGKLAATKEVYRHVTRTQPNPITLPKAMRDVVCLECHSPNRVVSATDNLIEDHDVHLEQGISCVTCHSGVAHAKMVERGINTNDTYDYWTVENADKLITRDYVKTNMGTCIDCHDQVNQGLKPWEDKNYIIAVPPNAFEGPILTSSEVFETVIRTASKGDKISMECQTCHIEMKIPNHHEQTDWNENHGEYAMKQLQQCITCHDENNWVKRVQPQSIEEILDETEKDWDSYVPDFKVAQREAANSIFCLTCHLENNPDFVPNNE